MTDLVAPQRRGAAFGGYNLAIGLGALPADLKVVVRGARAVALRLNNDLQVSKVTDGERRRGPSIFFLPLPRAAARGYSNPAPSG